MINVNRQSKFMIHELILDENRRTIIFKIGFSNNKLIVADIDNVRMLSPSELLKKTSDAFNEFDREGKT